MMLLELLPSGPDQLVVVLGVDDDLVRIVTVVAAIEDLVLILNLVVVRQLRRVVDADLAAALTRVLEDVVRVATTRRDIGRIACIRTIQATTVTSSSNMAHHLGIVQLGLNLAAFVRSVEHVLAYLRVWYLLGVVHRVRGRSLVVLLVCVGGGCRLVVDLLLVQMVLLRVELLAVVRARYRQILRLHLIRIDLSRHLLRCDVAWPCLAGQQRSLAVRRTILLIVVARV